MADHSLANDNPLMLLEEGSEVLAPLLARRGFRFQVTQVDRGSGGHFAVGVFSKGQRLLELHVRSNLGIVNYKWGEANLEHRDYMRFLGVDVERQAAYPTFSRERLGAFHALLTDLERFGGDFLTGRRPEMFADFASRLEANPTLFRRLP